MIYINNNTDKINNETAIALGKFDGLHLGHQLLFDEIVKGRKDGLLATVFTFDRSPIKVISGEFDGSIDTRYERMYMLEMRYIDALVEYPFTKEFASMEPEAFVRDVLICQFSMKKLVVGEDFCFGKNRSGNVSLLRELSRIYNFDLVIKKQHTYNNEIVSATLIKKYISEGNIKTANHLLDRRYMISGEVVSGRQLGRTIDFPTANLCVPEEKILPPLGVYHVTTTIDGKTYQGIANLGMKPTVKQDDSVGLETYILDYSGDLYGKYLQVEFLDFIRSEMKFENVSQLKEQIAKDIERVVSV